MYRQEYFLIGTHYELDKLMELDESTSIHIHLHIYNQVRLCLPFIVSTSLIMSLITTHTAPERCQPDKFATLSFSAFLVVCDQDKKLQVGQQILKGGNFCQLISLLLHHHLSVSFTNSSWNHCFPAFSHIYDQM